AHVVGLLYGVLPVMHLLLQLGTGGIIGIFDVFPIAKVHFLGQVQVVVSDRDALVAVPGHVAVRVISIFGVFPCPLRAVVPEVACVALRGVHGVVHGHQLVASVVVT